MSDAAVLYSLFGLSLESISMSMSLLYWVAQSWTQYTRCVVPVLSRREASLPSTCWQPSVYCKQGHCWLPLLVGALQAHGQLVHHQDPEAFLWTPALQTVVFSVCSDTWGCSCSILNSTIPCLLQLGLSLTFTSHTSYSQFISMRFSKAHPITGFLITCDKKLSSMYSRNLLDCLSPAVSSL